MMSKLVCSLHHEIKFFGKFFDICLSLMSKLVSSLHHEIKFVCSSLTPVSPQALDSCSTMLGREILVASVPVKQPPTASIASNT